MEVKPTLMRLIDILKQKQITSVFTSLTSGGVSSVEDSQLGVSSLMDTWILLRNVEFNGERNRTLYVLKSRGMNHSNQVREFVMSEKGIGLVDVYLGADQVLTGTARIALESQALADAELQREEHTRKLRQLAAKRKVIEAQIVALQAEAESGSADLDFENAHDALQSKIKQQSSSLMSDLRGGNENGTNRTKGKL